MKYLMQLLCALLCTFSYCDTAKILLYPAGHCHNSHLMNMERLASYLASHGHEIHMLIHSEYDTQKSRLDFDQVKLIQFQSPLNIPTHCEFSSIQATLDQNSGKVFRTFMNMVHGYCEALLNDTYTLYRLKQEDYDLVIASSIDFCSPLITDYIDKPFALLLSAGAASSAGLEGPTPYSYVPAVISSYTHKMTLLQRFVNTGNHLLLSFITNYVFLPAFQELRLKYNLNATIPLTATYPRASFKIVNGDFALDYPMPVMPGAIMAGTFFIRSPCPIQDELADFMDNAHEGIVLVSFGTIVRKYDDHWAEMFAGALAKLPQKVLWKFQGNIPSNLGNNTRLMKWLPQTNILAHRNTQLFVTHGGLNSATETSYYGVPVVALPLQGDQPYQATKLAEHAKIGLKLDIKTLTEGKLYQAMETVLHEPVYRENAARLSTLLHDKPISDGDQILFWVDYVIRHQGATHLKSEAVNLKWYQRNLLDVGALVVAVFLFVIYIIYNILKVMYIAICRYDCFIVKVKLE